MKIAELLLVTAAIGPATSFGATILLHHRWVCVGGWVELHRFITTTKFNVYIAWTTEAIQMVHPLPLSGNVHRVDGVAAVRLTCLRRCLSNLYIAVPNPRAAINRRRFVQGAWRDATILRMPRGACVRCRPQLFHQRAWYCAYTSSHLYILHPHPLSPPHHSAERSSIIK